MPNRFTIFALAAVLPFIWGCSGGSVQDEAISPEMTEELRTAIENYLEAKSFGMKIASFEQVQSEGDRATAVCKMQEAEGLYGLSVTWAFKFNRSSGIWKVESHEKR